MAKWKTVDVICPYFKRFRDNSIRCESLAPGFDSIVQRCNEDQVIKYACKYCNTFNYKLCPNAIILEREEQKHGNT